MPRLRFRLRTLMIVAAVAALFLAIAREGPMFMFPLVVLVSAPIPLLLLIRALYGQLGLSYSNRVRITLIGLLSAFLCFQVSVYLYAWFHLS